MDLNRNINVNRNLIIKNSRNHVIMLLTKDKRLFYFYQYSITI